MVNYNKYIRILTTGKKVFSIDIQGIELFSEYLGAIIKIGSDFT